MKWDEDAARKAVDEFHRLFHELEGTYRECIGKLSKAWRDSYGRCGHKRLGRIVLGYTPEEACKLRNNKEL